MARYAKSGDLHIAYVVEGDGPIDLVWIPPWISQVEYLWSEPSLERVMARLTQFARVITFDRRGSGLSDPFFGAPTLEEQMDDVLAVLDAAGSTSAAICGTLEGGPMAVLFAATHPDRTDALVLYATFSRATWAPDYEWAWSTEQRDRAMGELIAHWGEGLVASSVAPSQIADPGFMEWAGRLERLAASASWEALIGEIEEFLTGTRHEREPDRMLATVLFTDICDSTSRAAEMGDRGWRFLLERHDALFRQALERHRGREVKRTGDGFLATFDGPARAIRCAASLADAMGSLGLQIRAGLHTGELEVMDGDLGGLAVHIASRVMTAAGPNEVLVSGTVKDLVVGSGIDFEDRGERELRGVPGEWRLYAVN